MKKQILTLAALALVAGGALAQSNDTLAKIKSSGKAVMGVRESSAPLSYTLGGGKYVGYHVELCEQIIKKLAPSATIEYTPVTSANRIPLVQNGTVDIECGSTTNNATRQKDVSFGYTTYVTEVRTAVKKGSAIKSVADLDGKNVATTTGTTSVALLRKNERSQKIKFNEVYGKDHADSFLLLESGRADAFVMDDNILAGLIASSKSPGDYAIVGETLNVEPIAVMFRKDDPAFKKAVDEQISAMIKSGDIEKLYTKWFMTPIAPKNVSVNLPMGDTLKGLLKSPNDNPAESFAKK
ncbi:MAG: transporter substrate-binding domain-containing protein [Gammaproteobacteria bacterium]|nr:transporter substrate-binding domain-containing protein [Gammaproteobacteria bacterium]MBU1444436.1 transporter substrate-binding domain-containing protein [Gammaproteobacteria bacterium]MBU2284910.1 transporter substrate-binding domain-containing protein [Gammaproteobacteria bacterium]MBU2409521.1 transporter substrate-binding domain-containing protein [Gammaproteobacteria bacterium]